MIFTDETFVSVQNRSAIIIMYMIKLPVLTGVVDLQK